MKTSEVMGGQEGNSYSAIPNVSLKAIILMLSLALASCGTDEAGSNTVHAKLIGTWILDSASVQQGEYYIFKDPTETYTFDNDSVFSHEQRSFDSRERYSGRYALLHNPATGPITLVGAPDPFIWKGDTIWRAYDGFDILSLSDTQMVIRKPTEFYRSDSGEVPARNRQLWFSRLKE